MISGGSHDIIAESMTLNSSMPEKMIPNHPLNIKDNKEKKSKMISKVKEDTNFFNRNKDRRTSLGEKWILLGECHLYAFALPNSSHYM